MYSYMVTSFMYMYWFDAIHRYMATSFMYGFGAADSRLHYSCFLFVLIWGRSGILFANTALIESQLLTLGR